MKKFLCTLLAMITIISTMSITTASAKEKELFEYTYILCHDSTYYNTDDTLKMLAVSENSILVKIIDNGDYYYYAPTEYQIGILNKSTGEYQVVKTTSDEYATITNLSPNTSYTIAYKRSASYSQPDYDDDYYDYQEQGLNSYCAPITVTTLSNVKTSFTKATVGGTGKINLKWKKKGSSFSGYIIQYSTDKSFKDRMRGNYTLVSKKKTSYTISNLMSGTYYVRIAQYNKKNGKYFVSSWGNAKKVTIKNGVTLKQAINGIKINSNAKSLIKKQSNHNISFDPNKYKTTYDALKATYNWHSKNNTKKFGDCVDCNSNFASVCALMFSDELGTSDNIELHSGYFINRNGSHAVHSWAILGISGRRLIFDPRLQGYLSDKTGNTYFGIPYSSALGKRYVHDEATAKFEITDKNNRKLYQADDIKYFNKY